MMEYDEVISSLTSKAAHAVGLAEGFYVAGSLPARIFNPGDMELGDRGYGVDQGKTIYLKADPNANLEDETDGFSALRREWTDILTGNHTRYSTSFTFAQLALKWTGGDKPGAWCKIVTNTLNVNPLDTIAEWVEGAINANTTV